MNTTNHTSPSGEELKPCPMCGAAPKLIVGFSPLDHAFVDCECGMQTELKDSAEEVVAMWNRRADCRAQPLGEDAANGAIGEREVIEPLKEPVSIKKAMLAGRNAHVVRSGGTGPMCAVFLVNIQLTGWSIETERAEGFAKGFNQAAAWMQDAILTRAALTAEKVAAEPVAWMRSTDITELTDSEPETSGWIPLYAAPQPAQTQVALTQERIRKIAEEHFWGGKCTTADDLEKAIVAALREASLAAQPVSGGKS